MVSLLVSEVLRDVIIYKEDFICVFVTDHYVFRFHITVHEVLRVEILKSLHHLNRYYQHGL